MLRSPEEALRLAEDVRAELEAIARVVGDAEQILARSGPAEPERMVVYASGAILHSFYTGVEKVLLHIAPALNGGAPRDPAWHRRLLEQMSRPLPGVRPAVVSQSSARALEEYLAFRHRFRSLYAFDLDWSKVRDLLARLRATWEQVEPDLAQLESFLREVHAGA